MLRAHRSRSSGKERDAETGLDYFGARYHGNNMGRWLSPDWNDDATTVPYADFNNPQTLNLYAFVRNSPATLPDNDGHSTCGRAETCLDQSSEPPPSKKDHDQQQRKDEPKQEIEERNLTSNKEKEKNQETAEDDNETPPVVYLGRGGRGKGGSGKGERRKAAKPEGTPNPAKHARYNPQTGRYEVKDPHTGKWVPKPPGWNPNSNMQIDSPVGVPGVPAPKIDMNEVKQCITCVIS